MTIGKKSKTKGSSYELKVAKLLATWSGEGVHRVPQSGAGGSTWGADSRMNGDIVFPVESKNPFVYECKKREGFELAHLFKNIGEPRKWLEQVVTDARRMEKFGMSPCLIFSKNRDIDYVLLPYSDDIYNKLVGTYPVSRQMVSFENIRDEIQYFDTMLLTLEGFMSFEKQYIFDHYINFDWDKYNNE